MSQNGIRRPVRTAGAIATVLLLVGCDLSAPERSAPRRPVDGSSAATGAPPTPHPGQCRAVPAARAVAPAALGDDSPVVTCAEAHTTETVAIYRNTKPTAATGARYARRCLRDAAGYASVSVQDLPVFMAATLRTSRHRAGRAWLRCDLAVLADTHGTRAATISGSLKRVRITRRVAYMPCLDQLPKADRNQPRVPCNEPHRARWTGMRIWLNKVSAYPSDAVLTRRGRAGCRYALDGPPLPRRLIMVPVWQRPDQMTGHTLHGYCWIARRDGTRLPPAQ